MLYAARSVAVEKAAVDRRRSNVHSALTLILVSGQLDGHPPIRKVRPVTIGIRRRRRNGLLGLPDEIRSVRRRMEHFVERSDEPAGRYLLQILPSLARDLPSPPTRIRKGINDKEHSNSSDHELHLVNLPRRVFCEMLAGFVRRRVTVQAQSTRATRNPPMVPQVGRPTRQIVGQSSSPPTAPTLCQRTNLKQDDRAITIRTRLTRYRVPVPVEPAG